MPLLKSARFLVRDFVRGLAPLDMDNPSALVVLPMIAAIVIVMALAIFVDEPWDLRVAPLFWNVSIAWFAWAVILPVTVRLLKAFGGIMRALVPLAIVAVGVWLLVTSPLQVIALALIVIAALLYRGIVAANGGVATTEGTGRGPSRTAEEARRWNLPL